MKKNLALPAMFMVLLLTACQKQDLRQNDSLESTSKSKKSSTLQENKTNTFYGPQVHSGDGKVRSFISITHTGVPQEIGLEMTAGSLNGLSMEDHVSYVVPFHQKAKAITPFDHIYFNWNPHGHPPLMFFSAPHFDFHFYMTSVEERMMIPAYSSNTAALFHNYPPAGYMPPDYSTPPGPDGSEPEMGKHWLPPPPTFLPFTKVMVLGSFNGHFTFIEPMITLNYLQSKASSSQPYSQPALFEHTGKYYPTIMNIYYEDGKHYVSLSGFVLR